jgi:putative ABC transport system permease protein
MVFLGLKELRRQGRAWASVVFVQLVTSLLLALSLGLTISGATQGTGDVQGEYSSLGGVQIGFVVLAGIACVAVMTRIVVSMNRAAIAQWQLAGLSPRRASRTIFLMTVMSALAGCSIGAALGLVAWKPFGAFVLSASMPFLPALREPMGVAPALGAFAAGVSTCVVAAALNLRKVSRIEAVEVVRLHPMAASGRSWKRGSLALLLLGGLGAAYWGISVAAPITNADDLGGIVGSYWGCALLLILVTVAAGDVVFPAVFRVVCAFLPRSLGVSAFLARGGVMRRGCYSSAMLVPLLVAGGVVGSTYGMVYQAMDVARVLGADAGTMSPPRQMLLIFGAPVIVAMSTTVATVFATSRQSLKDVAQLLVLGTSRAAVVRSTILEHVVYLLATLSLCYGILCVNGWFVAFALSRGPVPGARFVAPGWAPLLVIGSGSALALLVALLPIAGRALRSPMTASKGALR